MSGPRLTAALLLGTLALGGVFADLFQARALHSEAEEDEGGPEFGYGKEDGPRTWPATFPTCGGRRQSPIDLDLHEAEEAHSDDNPALVFEHYGDLPKEMAVVNTGHGLALRGKWAEGHRPAISGFVLRGDYVLSEVHFHWGRNAEEGSEHLVNGRSYPLEMHVVHFKKKYRTIEEAVQHKDGLAVVGYFFKVGRSSALQRLLDKSGRVIDSESPPASISPFRLEELVPSFKRKFVSYSGSLTTPLCNQVVTWIVNLKPLSVSLKQLSQLRILRDHHGSRILRNFRPPQPLNRRTVTCVH